MKYIATSLLMLLLLGCNDSDVDSGPEIDLSVSVSESNYQYLLEIGGYYGLDVPYMDNHSWSVGSKLGRASDNQTIQCGVSGHVYQVISYQTAVSAGAFPTSGALTMNDTFNGCKYGSGTLLNGAVTKHYGWTGKSGDDYKRQTTKVTGDKTYVTTSDVSFRIAITEQLGEKTPEKEVVSFNMFVDVSGIGAFNVSTASDLIIPAGEYPSSGVLQIAGLDGKTARLTANGTEYPLVELDGMVLDTQISWNSVW